MIKPLLTPEQRQQSRLDAAARQREKRRVAVLVAAIEQRQQELLTLLRTQMEMGDQVLDAMSRLEQQRLHIADMHAKLGVIS